MIENASIEQLKAHLDVVDVVGNYVELKKSGTNFKGLCPFHDEKSPSFMVSPSKQIYHCFGCSAGGDSIKFVMEYEKLSYPEAIEKLASQYNVTLNYTKGSNVAQTSSRVLEQIQAWFVKLLNHHSDSLEYLKKRGVYSSSIEKFGIGYAPTSAMTLTFLQGRHLLGKEAVDLGVVGQDGGRNYARFVERIIFPIHSVTGKLVGFGGRTIVGHPAKYVNSPQSPLFNKSRLLYAYDKAKQSVYEQKSIIVTEGYLDVIMLHQAGFTNAVATLGTALTTEHLPLLRKGEPEVIVAYDGDSAGVAAALKAAKLLSGAGIAGGIVLFEDGKDPADMVKDGHSDELKQLFLHPKNLVTFVLEQIFHNVDINDVHQKEQARKEIQVYLNTLSLLMQESCRREAESYFGSSVALFKENSQKKDEPSTPKYVDSYDDAFVQTILKTLLNQHELINVALEYLDATVLGQYSKHFALLRDGQYDDSLLNSISLNRDIKALNEDEALDSRYINTGKIEIKNISDDEFKKELITFFLMRYKNELKFFARRNDVSVEQKVFIRQKILDKIAKLKRGELTAYERDRKSVV